jgi:membrane protease YdiL (CAAX protease family)
VPPEIMTILTEAKTPQDSRESVAADNKVPEQDKTVSGLKPKFQVAITILCSNLAMILFALIEIALNIDVSRGYFPLLAFPLNILILYKLYPQILKIPFGEVKPMDFARRIGFSKPQGLIKYIILGSILAMCSLTGLMVGSILTGLYSFDLAALTVEQIVFSTVPGVWEEIYFRGILMFILLIIVKDVRKALVLQSVIFGLLHFRGLELWALVDIVSVVLIALTYSYTAHKTNSLIPTIVAHYLHDAFLFLVQVPKGVQLGTFENLVVCFSLWIMLGVGCLITKLAAEKIGITQPTVLYDIDKLPQY